MPQEWNHKCATLGFPPKSSHQRAPSYGDGEEREEMLLKLSDQSLEPDLSLEWSTKFGEWERRKREVEFVCSLFHLGERKKRIVLFYSLNTSKRRRWPCSKWPAPAPTRPGPARPQWSDDTNSRSSCDFQSKRSQADKPNKKLLRSCLALPLPLQYDSTTTLPQALVLKQGMAEAAHAPLSKVKWAELLPLKKTRSPTPSVPSHVNTCMHASRWAPRWLSLTNKSKHESFLLSFSCRHARHSALFSSQIFFVFGYCSISFLFDKHCPITE